MSTRFESGYVTNKQTAQQYYEGREITERMIPLNEKSSYKSEYPAHPLQPHNRAQTAPSSVFNSGKATVKSLYQDTYPGWWEAPKRFVRPTEDLPPSMPFYSTTSYGSAFTKKSATGARQKQAAERPWPERPFVPDTTYSTSYDPNVVARGRPAKKVPQPEPELASIPFSALSSTYARDFVPQKGQKYVRARNTNDKQFAVRKFVATTTHGDTFRGIQLPQRRMNLGVQVLGGAFHVLIPKHKPWPASASHVFSTARNNQNEICVLCLQGNSNIAKENSLLGQFSLVNIPPAPQQVPAIEVTFRVDARGKLTAEAKDLDHDRHKQWTAARGAIVIK